MDIGLKQTDIDYIINTFKLFHEVEKAIVFGSRAMGHYKKGSDIDIALMGKEVTFTTIAKMKDLLQEESPMPYMFDIVDYTHSKSTELKNHIDNNGITIYEKNKLKNIIH